LPVKTTKVRNTSEKGPVIVGELELVVALDAGDFGVGQARSDLVSACLGQPPGGFFAQTSPFAANHPRTLR